jgi:hypothetical protein
MTNKRHQSEQQQANGNRNFCSQNNTLLSYIMAKGFYFVFCVHSANVRKTSKFVPRLLDGKMENCFSENKCCVQFGWCLYIIRICILYISRKRHQTERKREISSNQCVHINYFMNRHHDDAEPKTNNNSFKIMQTNLRINVCVCVFVFCKCKSRYIYTYVCFSVSGMQFGIPIGFSFERYRLQTMLMTMVNVCIRPLLGISIVYSPCETNAVGLVLATKKMNF